MSGAALDWKPGRASTNGVELAYEEAGPSNGACVLLIPGLSWQLIHWPDDYCRRLVERGLRVIRIDNRDAGLSTILKGRTRINLIKATIRSKLRLSVQADYTLHDMAADVIGLLDALAIERVHLVGMSMGGMIAQVVAGTAPERVASLTSIMSTTNHPWLPGAAAAVQKRLISRSPDNQRETIVARDMAMQAMIGSPRYPASEQERRALAERAFDRAHRPGGVLRQMNAIIATGSFERTLKNISAPTQIIHGRDDLLVRPAGGRRSAKRIRGAKLAIIDGMGHDLPQALLPQIAQLTLDNIASA